MAEFTVQKALQKAIQAHRAGRLHEADRLYTSILQAQPTNTDANHNMGVLAVDVGKVFEALPFFSTALKLNPKIVQYWLSYINALIKLNRTDEAKAVFDRAKRAGMKGDEFELIESLKKKL